MKQALVIMAAGMGSRYDSPDANGNRKIKQLEQVGPNGEIIMDYSIHDAIEAGYNKVVFVIRHDIEKSFREIIGDRIEKICAKKNVEVAYAYQELEDLPDGFTLPEDRTKPWGTGQAILVTKDVVNEPYTVINADDYYGKTAFKIIHDRMDKYNESEGNKLTMAGFVLKNTLSDNGGVTRGICQMENGLLTAVKETKNIEKIVDESGNISAKTGDTAVDTESLCSMNFWGLTPDFTKLLEDGFVDFLKNTTDELKDEFLLPIYIDKLIQEGKVSVEVLKTPDSWFGVTYKEDKQTVVDSFEKLTKEGVYNRSGLFED